MRKHYLSSAAAVAFVAVSAAADALDCLRDWPSGVDPKTVATRVARQFMSGLETFGPEKDWVYEPMGYAGSGGYGSHGRPNGIHYCVAILWAHAIECARLTGDRWLEKRLIDKFELFYNERKDALPPPYHVDMTVFGMLPLEIYCMNGDKRALDMGLKIAENQWAKPQASDFDKLSASVMEQNLPLDRQLALWKDGYTPQTRLWIDDMFMIIAVQSQAWRATGDVCYIERSAKEMVLYLDELQIRKPGKDYGLFYHAPDVPFLWARGDGWMAAGMTEVLKALPSDNVHYARILKGYRDMMAALYEKQDLETGLWNELVGDKNTWAETSGSGMFAYAFVEGVKNGWFGEKTEEYAARARAAYLGLVKRLDNFGNVADVCIGTAKENDYQYYVDRPHVTGDPHGQSPLLWVCEALMTLPARVSATANTANVGDYGIQSRIDAASAAGGGVVTVAPGRYLDVRPIVLKSNVTLNVAAGAVLHATTNLSAYALMPGEDRGAFISASDATNVAIVGTGRIECAGDRMPKLQGVPRRWRGVHFRRCRGVRIEGVTLANSYFWGCYLQQCEDVVIRKMKIFSHANFNNDGLDLEVRNALVEDCDIDSDDDSIVFKNFDRGFLVENVEVRRCRVGGNTNSIKIGTETTGDFRNIFIHDCIVSPRQNSDVWPLSYDVPGLDMSVPSGKGGIVIASVDGGTIDGVRVRDIVMEGVETPIYVRLGRRRGGDRESGIRNVLVENIKAKAVSRIACSVTGVPGEPARRPENIVLRNIAIDVPGGTSDDDRLEEPVPECETGYPSPRNFRYHLLPACGVYIRHADGVKLENVTVTRRSPDVRPDFVRDDAP